MDSQEEDEEDEFPDEMDEFLVADDHLSEEEMTNLPERARKKKEKLIP